MKKWIKYMVTAFLAVLLVGIFASCTPETEEKSPKQLDMPSGLVLYQKELTWEKVDRAKGYVVVVDEGEEERVNYNFYEISDYPEAKTFVIKVKAVGDGVNYVDSDWTEYTYVYETPTKNLKYTLLKDGSGYEVARGSKNHNEGLEGRVVIPDFYNGLPVTKIADNAFFRDDVLGIDPVTGVGCNTVTTSIRLPAYLETIGEKAFGCCIVLESIDIPESVTYIGERAFASCKKINEFELPKGVTLIEKGMFAGTAIAKMPIHENITEVREGAFQGCDMLEEVDFPAYITTIEGYTFSKCKNLKKITIPNSVTEIKNAAFSSCESLESIVIPESVTALGNALFMSCDRLKEVTLPSRLTAIGNQMFSDCNSLESITLPAGVTSIGDDAFARCGNLKSITLPVGITSIGDDAFLRCENLTELSIPASVTSIGTKAFVGCFALTNISVAEDNENYYSIDGNLYTKDGVLFQYAIGKKDTVFKIPEGTTVIGINALQKCNTLMKIEIPDSVTSIGKWAFYYCNSLTNIYYYGTAEDWSEIDVDSSNERFIQGKVYYYSENQPTEAGNYWHYDENGAPVVW